MSFLLDIMRRASLFIVFLLSATNFAWAEDSYRSRTVTITDKSVFARALSISGDRMAFATHEDQMIHIFDMSNGKELAPLAAGDGNVAYMVWSPDSSLLLAAKRKEMILFDVASGKQRGVISPSVDYALFSPDSKNLILAGQDGIGQLWDVASMQKATTLQGPNSAFLGAKFSPDGKHILEEPFDKTLRIWDIASKTVITTMKGDSDYVDDEWYSADGDRVLSVSKDKTARVWDAASGSQIAMLLHPDDINSAEFDHDGKRVVTGSDDHIARVFNVESGKEISELKADNMDRIQSASFNSDGTRIVTRSYDDKLRIWSAADGKLITELKYLRDDRGAARFSADGESILAFDSTSATVWTLQKTKAEQSSAAAESAKGLWYRYSEGDNIDDDMIHVLCAYSPMKIEADGLILIYSGETGNSLEVGGHMRCKADMSCDFFAGPPTTDIGTPSETVTLTIADGRGDMCSANDPNHCAHFARCPEIKWSDDERKGGYADLWEKQVMAPPN